MSDRAREIGRGCAYFEHVPDRSAKSVVDEPVVGVAPRFDEGGNGGVVCGEWEDAVQHITKGRVLHMYRD